MATAMTEIMRQATQGDSIFAADGLSQFGSGFSLADNFGQASAAPQVMTAAPVIDAAPQSLLETMASPFVDRNIDNHAAAPQNPNLQDIQQQLDAIRETGWKPEIAPARDKISTDVVRGNEASANMVTDAHDKLHMINAAEQDLNKFVNAQPDGRSPQDGARADAGIGAGIGPGISMGGGMRGLAFDTVATAGLAALNPALGAGYAALSLAKSVQQVQQAFTGAGPATGQGSFGNPTASARSSGPMTKAEAREYRQSGAQPGRDSSPAQNTFEQAGRTGAAPMPIEDMIFASNNTRDSLASINDSPVPVKETPGVMALREDIRSIKADYQLQKDTGEELQDVYENRARHGVEANADSIMDAMDRGMKLNTQGGPVINGAMA